MLWFELTPKAPLAFLSMAGWLVAAWLLIDRTRYAVRTDRLLKAIAKHREMVRSSDAPHVKALADSDLYLECELTCADFS